MALAGFEAVDEAVAGENNDGDFGAGGRKRLDGGAAAQNLRGAARRCRWLGYAMARGLEMRAESGRRIVGWPRARLFWSRRFPVPKALLGARGLAEEGVEWNLQFRRRRKSTDHSSEPSPRGPGGQAGDTGGARAVLAGGRRGPWLGKEEKAGEGRGGKKDRREARSQTTQSPRRRCIITKDGRG